MKLSKQQKQRLNNLIDSITDTSQKYCYKCAKEQDKLILSSDCKEHSQYFTIAYCPIHKHMQVYRFSKCARCTFEHNGLRVSYCSKCDKDTMHNGAICTVCHPMDIGSRMKYCSICQKVTQHFGKRCAICTGVKNGMRIIYCPVCKKDTKHNGSVCTVCSEMKIGFMNIYCDKCKKITQHTGSMCFICNNIITGAHYAYCDVCNKETLFNSGVCTKCHPESFARSKVSYCPKCKKDTNHKGGYCLYCHFNKNTHVSDFTKKNGKRYYKGIEVHQLSQDFLSGKRDIKDYPGFSIRFGTVYYHNKDIITGEEDSFDNIIIKKDGKRYFVGYEVNQLCKDILSGKININEFTGLNNRFGSTHYHTENLITDKYEPIIRTLMYKNNNLYYGNELWDNYKKHFLEESKGIPLYSGFWLDVTDNFEDELVEKSVSWFTYIKFYYKDNNICPIVASKSGSKLVNKCGSDISFSYNYDLISHPARRLLSEENLKWVDNKVYIIPAETQERAFKLECKMTTKHNLFMS